MVYWKISNETINDIKNQLDKFVKTTKNAVIRQAENLARFIKKGGQIGVEGKLQTRRYQA